MQSIIIELLLLLMVLKENIFLIMQLLKFFPLPSDTTYKKNYKGHLVQTLASMLIA